jgi:hypothetical protein
VAGEAYRIFKVGLRVHILPDPGENKITKSGRRGNMINKYDPLIRKTAGEVWPGLDWNIIKHQVNQESAFNPKAISQCGASGLLQLMPATAMELGVETRDDLFDPEKNLLAGITYLKRQYVALKEIPDRDERIKFALASYNGGRGYINAAIKLAILAAKAKGEPAVLTWDVVSRYLSNPECKVNGKRPDHKQINDYVKRIWGNYIILRPFDKLRAQGAVEKEKA